jgi:hypothetical protein
MSFVSVWIFVAASLVALSMTGGFLIATLPGRYVILTAPLAGIATFACFAAVLYGALHLTFSSAALLILTGCGLLTLVVARHRFGLPDLFRLGLCVMVFSALATGAITIASVRSGAPSIFIGDGTDAMNYADVADWVRAHKITDLQSEPTDRSYEQLPRVELQSDPRTGAFYFLALVGWLNRSPSLFAVDPANAIAWVAGILGVAGAFASRRRELLFIMVGLSLSAWFDYSRMGFMGKLLNYPASMMLAGFVLAIPQPRIAMYALAIIAVGIALLHSALATILVFATVCGGVLALRSLNARTLARDETLLAGTLCLIVIATSGTLARFFYATYPDWDVTWNYAWPRILDLDNQGVRLTGLSDSGVVAVTAFSIATWAILIAFGLARRNEVATGLLIAPALLLLILVVFDARAVAFQLIGFFYPLTIIAAAALIPSGPLLSVRAPTTLALVILLPAIVAARAPRFAGGLERYVFHPSQTLIFSTQTLEELKNVIGTEQVLVDATDRHSGHVFRTMFMPIFGKQIQWTERAWRNAALHYPHDVPLPTYSARAAFTIVNASPGPHASRPVVWRTPSIVVLKGAISNSEQDLSAVQTPQPEPP